MVPFLNNNDSHHAAATQRSGTGGPFSLSLRPTITQLVLAVQDHCFIHLHHARLSAQLVLNQPGGALDILK